MQEIKEAVFSMAPEKAPGPDGFTIVFFQEYWGIVQPDLVELFRQLHLNGRIPKSLNATFITLIPKKEALVYKTFGPLALCHVPINHFWSALQKNLEEVIYGNQYAFVKGRNILDSILLRMNVWKIIGGESKKEWSWSLIWRKHMTEHIGNLPDYVVATKGFRVTWRKWIYGCLSWAHFSVILNGFPHGFFPASRGLRQVFTLVMASLSQIIINA